MIVKLMRQKALIKACFTCDVLLRILSRNKKRPYDTEILC